MNSSPRLLAVRFSALGDVAMTVAAIYSLAARYPELHIDVATTPFCARLFINPPSNVEVHGFDLKKQYSGPAGTLRLLKALSALHPTLVADLHNVARSWVIDFWFRLRGVKVRMVDKMRSSRSDVLSRRKAQPNFVDRYCRVFGALGYPVDPTFVSVFPDGTPEPAVEVAHPAVGIAPFARYYNKTYPLEMMREVVEKLTERGVNVYLFGGRGQEAEVLGGWTPFNSRCHSLAGKFSLEQELALMANMDLMVSMDSANQHMASLTATPVVSIWGSTTPECGFMGYGRASENVLVARLDCQPCSIAGKPECPLGTLECMHALSPSAVANKILSMLRADGKTISE